MSHNRWLRASIVCLLAGILLELIAFFLFTPATFLIFVLLGVPLMLLGIGLYGVHVVRHLRSKDAL